MYALISKISSQYQLTTVSMGSTVINNNYVTSDKSRPSHVVNRIRSFMEKVEVAVSISCSLDNISVPTPSNPIIKFNVGIESSRTLQLRVALSVRAHSVSSVYLARKIHFHQKILICKDFVERRSLDKLGYTVGFAE